MYMHVRIMALGQALGRVLFADTIAGLYWLAEGERIEELMHLELLRRWTILCS